MKIVLITGMSGTRKSTVIATLQSEGLNNTNMSLKETHINMKIFIICFICCIVFIACKNNKYKIDTYDNLKKELKGIEVEKEEPVADPGGFEREVNNGGLNQYFFNSSGQHCFETLRYFQKNERNKEAAILEAAIKLINPKNLSEAEFINKLRNREVTELDDPSINKKLDSLDNVYYRS